MTTKIPQLTSIADKDFRDNFPTSGFFGTIFKPKPATHTSATILPLMKKLAQRELPSITMTTPYACQAGSADKLMRSLSEMVPVIRQSEKYFEYAGVQLGLAIDAIVAYCNDRENSIEAIRKFYAGFKDEASFFKLKEAAGNKNFLIDSQDLFCVGPLARERMEFNRPSTYDQESIALAGGLSRFSRWMVISPPYKHKPGMPTSVVFTGEQASALAGQLAELLELGIPIRDEGIDAIYRGNYRDLKRIEQNQWAQQLERMGSIYSARGISGLIDNLNDDTLISLALYVVETPFVQARALLEAVGDK